MKPISWLFPCSGKLRDIQHSPVHCHNPKSSLNILSAASWPSVPGARPKLHARNTHLDTYSTFTQAGKSTYPHYSHTCRSLLNSLFEAIEVVVCVSMPHMGVCLYSERREEAHLLDTFISKLPKRRMPREVGYRATGNDQAAVQHCIISLPSPLYSTLHTSCKCTCFQVGCMVHFLLCWRLNYKNTCVRQNLVVDQNNAKLLKQVSFLYKIVNVTFRSSILFYLAWHIEMLVRKCWIKLHLLYHFGLLWQWVVHWERCFCVVSVRTIRPLQIVSQYFLLR